MFYEVSDAGSGNRIATFKDEDEALSCLSTLIERDPGEKRRLLLSILDEDGHTRESWLAGELLSPDGEPKLRIPELH